MSSITIQGLGNTEMIFNYLNLIGVPKKHIPQRQATLEAGARAEKYRNHAMDSYTRFAFPHSSGGQSPRKERYDH
ncbi:hypothetical protein [Methylomonas koyamae]|uniref:hypothetical protein n=1 Tax=Methylomonas koyamae TaxID=702114 RepID=UPI002872F4E5|nr:hypothetical protein [Methylomonas koyamae]WNB74111.1 hypothetical protein RI210_12540 [Methylomonas koyamae]